MITKCDLCKKQIKGKPVMAGKGFSPRIELCDKCGAPILRFLEKHKFIEKKSSKK